MVSNVFAMSGKPIQYTPVYNRKGQLNAKGEGLIQIEAYKDAKRVYFSTGIYIRPECWDKAKERVIKHQNSHSYNNRITQLIEGYKTIEDNNRTNPGFSVTELKRAVEKTDSTSFTGFALGYLAKEKNLSLATKSKYLNSITTFKAFAKGDVLFSDLDKKLIDEFRLHLVELGISPNTQKIYFKHLGKYAKQAVDYGYLEYTKNPFPALKITGEKTTRFALDESELKKLEKHKFSPEQKHLQLIRDLFLMACYTGLRFGDISRLSAAHIHQAADGMEIRMISEKEKKQVNLPLRYLFPVPGKLLSKPEQLIKKYWRDDKKPFFLALKTQGKAANNQYTNRVLKDIQEMTGIQTKLTNHVGRHTFATFLIWRVPVPVVQELLQHSKIDTTMIYIHVGTDKVKEHLKKINDWV